MAPILYTYKVGSCYTMVMRGNYTLSVAYGGKISIEMIENHAVLTVLSERLWLSLKELRKLEHILMEIRNALYRALSSEDEEVVDTSHSQEDRFDEKVRVDRYYGVFAHIEAVLTFCKCFVVLTRDEVATMQIEIMCLIQDIEAERAHFFYAVSMGAKDTSVHIVEKHRQDRRGPVLCGELPPLNDEHPLKQIWTFVPGTGDPSQRSDKEWPLCPVCVAQWQTKHQSSRPLLQSSDIAWGGLYTLYGLSDAEKVYAWGESQLHAVLSGRVHPGERVAVYRHESNRCLGVGLYLRTFDGSFIVEREKGECRGLLCSLFPHHVRLIFNCCR